jgi:hypothetical protein
MRLVKLELRLGETQPCPEIIDLAKKSCQGQTRQLITSSTLVSIFILAVSEGIGRDKIIGGSTLLSKLGPMW